MVLQDHESRVHLNKVHYCSNNYMVESMGWAMPSITMDTWNKTIAKVPCADSLEILFTDCVDKEECINTFLYCGTCKYLYGERDTIGENSTKCHGLNCVVSMLHHFFATHINGEEECYLHANNCGGQNKNKTMMAWRCITGIHHQITLSFMITGHTRCLVDGCFGLVKQKYRRCDSDTISHLLDVVNKSASCNQAQVYRSSSGASNWQWWNWVSLYFKLIKGIRKLHHFRFTQAKPGTVYVKEGISNQDRGRSRILKGHHELSCSAGDLNVNYNEYFRSGNLTNFCTRPYLRYVIPDQPGGE